MGLHNRYLPLWLHRLCNGLLGAVAAATVAVLGMSVFPVGHVLHTVSLVLLLLSLPIGVFLAVIAPRFSIAEGLAGEMGYDELGEDEEDMKKT